MNKLFVFGIYLLMSNICLSKNIHSQVITVSLNNKGFTENKGQVSDRDIKYFAENNDVTIICKKQNIQFVFREQEPGRSISEASSTPFYGHDPQSKMGQHIHETNYKFISSALTFLNSNPDVQIIANSEEAYTQNYYLPQTPENGITHVRSYKSLIYKNIYRDIDLELKIRPEGIEYAFMINPGGHVKDIKLKWDGVQDLQLIKKDDFQFKINEKIKIEETGLSCLQDSKKIFIKYRKNGHTVSFKTGNYDRRKPLIIDPLLQWASYVGGNGDEAGRAVTTDADDNIYLTGWTSSLVFSTDSTKFKGFYDAFISKFTKDGKLIWSTYYGGNDIDNGYGITIDKSGNLYICGSTASSEAIATSGAWQKSLGGFTDGFLAKFNGNGLRIWSTYFGGAENDQVLGISSDDFANVYITGFTLSSSGIATKGSYDSIYSGARDNGFLAKFDSSGFVKWATYYGGDQNDYSSGVAADNLGNVYIAGNCSSHNGISTSGAYRTSVGGYYDGFLAKFTDAGTLVWGTYFGNNGDDECEAVCTDTLGNAYITGNTSSDSGIATAEAYQTSYTGAYDVFLAKFNADGAIQWATYYGGTNDDFAWAIDINKSQNIAISGYTNSATGISTRGSYQPVFNGNADGYVAQFNSDGNIIYGTYFGGQGNDFGYAVRSDLSDNLLIAGLTFSSSGISSSGAFSGSLSGSSDAFLAKFNNPNSAINSPGKNMIRANIYPNPVIDKTTLKYTISSTSKVDIALYNTSGEIITILFHGIQNTGNQLFELNTAQYHLKKGIYYVSVKTTTENSVQKIVIL